MKNSTIIGIDLGTTNCAVAYVNPAYDKAEIIPNGEGRNITPSVVQIQPDGSAVVGETAKQEIAIEKEHTAQFFKRDMGTAAVYNYRGRDYTPTDLSAEVLKKLKADAEAFLQKEVRQAVITVPAYFDDKPRVATRQAGEQAGLEVLQMIDEPTAAAVAYGFSHLDKDETVLVYDLGGGTFDISLVRINSGAIKVIGTDGNHHLGGKDWDDAILKYLSEQFEKRHGFDPLDEPFSFQDLLIRAEEAKKVLSSRSSTAVTINCRGVMERIEVTREVFESRTSELLAQTEMLIQQVIDETSLTFDQISSVLMVGGSTRMPACAELIRKLTGKAPNTSINPDECVAVGAAIQGAEYDPAKKQFFLSGSRIHSATSHSLGMVAVSADGNRFINSVIIPRNKPIPSSEVRPYQATTRGHGDNRITVYVTQGEGEDLDNCSFVGKYVISQIPFETSGKSVLDISYEYDRSGIVRVSAVHKKSHAPLPVAEAPLPEDMSWVFQSPRMLVPPHKTIYLAIDLSGSMSGSPLTNAQEAMVGFVQNSDLANTSIGLIAFADQVQLMVSASQNAKEILRAIDSLKIGLVGGANSGQPFDLTFEQLGNVKGPRFLVALTDGVWSRQEHAVERAKICHQAGVEIIAIGFGDADEKFLRHIATSDQSILLSGSTELTATFENIAHVLVEGMDQSSLTGLFLKGKR